MKTKNDQHPTPASVTLAGLDGSNPLAFLAALGTLRTLTSLFPDSNVTMHWAIESGAWRPTLEASMLELDPQQLCTTMSDWLSSPPQMELFESIGDNLTLSPKEFRTLALTQLRYANEADKDCRIALAFLAAFGTDAAFQPHLKDRSQMQDTALRTMSGAGWQHFIKFMRDIIQATESTHLYSSLFKPWMYEDEGRGLNLRWDPIDDRRYAMRWKNPSSDPTKSMRGANRLAIEALPLFPTAPMGSKLETAGFRVSKGAFWSWPIWEGRLELPVVQSLLNLALISRNSTGEGQVGLQELGISVVFKSQRITVGKFRNFTPAKAV